MDAVVVDANNDDEEMKENVYEVDVDLDADADAEKIRPTSKKQSVLTTGSRSLYAPSARLIERCERIRQRHTRVVRIERPSVFRQQSTTVHEHEPEREPLTPAGQ